MSGVCCLACGNRIPNSDALFCPYCGAKLDAAEPERDAFKAAVARLYALYEGYENWVCAYFAERDSFAHTLAYGLGGKNSFYKRPEHQAFLDSVVNCGRELEESFRVKPDENRGMLMDLLSFVLLECHRNSPGEAAWLYRAAEQICLPFLPHLSAEEAGSLYPAYKILRKKEPGLPVQTEILRALKKRRT